MFQNKENKVYPNPLVYFLCLLSLKCFYPCPYIIKHMHYINSYDDFTTLFFCLLNVYSIHSETLGDLAFLFLQKNVKLAANFPGGPSVKEPAFQCRDIRDCLPEI